MGERIEIGSTFAGYRVESVLGRGGMGVVFRAEQPRLGRRVAIKVIAPELASDETFRERFSREARLAAAIEHPNAIPIYEAGVESGTPYLVMRFVDGIDLSTVIKRDGRITAARAVAVTEQVAGALDEAHHRGLVHRDVKPANVLVEDRRGSEHAYLTDFGLTKQTDSLTGVTATGRWVGTIDYASPEQIRGKRIDARADVYSLGCMLFASLTGRVPFERDADVAKLYAHINDPPPLVGSFDPDLPRELDRVVSRALAKDPDERFQSAGDLARAAHAAVHGEPVSKAERTVATGAAAPDESVEAGDVAAPTPPSGPQAMPGNHLEQVPPTVDSQRPASEGATSPDAAEGVAGRPPDATGAGKGSGGDGGPTPSRLQASPGEAPTRLPSPLPREKRSLIGILLLVAVLVVAAIVAFAGSGGGGGDPTTPTAPGSSDLADSYKTLRQPSFTVKVPAEVEIPKGKTLAEDLPTSVRTELRGAGGLDVQIVSDKAGMTPNQLIDQAEASNEQKAAQDGSFYRKEDRAEVSVKGDPAVRYEYALGADQASASSVVVYAFERGGKSWRARTQRRDDNANVLALAGENSLRMAQTLEPR